MYVSLSLDMLNQMIHDHPPEEWENAGLSLKASFSLLHFIPGFKSTHL